MRAKSSKQRCPALRIFVQIAVSRHYLFEQNPLPLMLTLTYQFPFFFYSPFYTGSPSQQFNSYWVEPFTLLRNAALRLSFATIRFKYKQKNVNIG